MILLDANILVYAHDPAEADKQARALACLDEVNAAGVGRLSSQVLGEFFVIATRLRGQGALLSVEDARLQVDRFLRAWRVLEVTPAIVAEAVRGVKAYQLPYWDAQLWATARLNQVPILFSEDFNTGATIEGVRFVNPLALGFDIRSWI